MIILNGDLLTTPFHYIAHQVNCQGIMGGGVALAIRNKYPEVYTKYQEFIRINTNEGQLESRELLGYCLPTITNDKKHTILNLFGQDQIGRDKRYTEYDKLEEAILDGLNPIKHHTMRKDGCQITIAIPYKMGAGLAGGDWNIISSMLEQIEQTENVVFVAYKI